MKKSVLAIICAIATTAGAMAQGTVTFANIGGGVNAPVTVAATGAAVGTDFMAQLYAGASASSLAAVGSPVAFVGNGFFTGGTVTVPTVAPGATGSFQVRAWRSADGASYDAAVAAAGVVGQSGTFPVATGGAGQPPGPPASLTGLTAFTVAPIPEPTTIALGLIGAAALFLRRRK
jgi:hypothetical protein